MTIEEKQENLAAETFRARFAEARRLRKITFKDLSLKSGINLTQISNFSAGQRVPSFHNLRALAVALEISVDFLLGLTDIIEIPKSAEND